MAGPDRKHRRCIICGDPKTHAKDRCQTCYRYLWRHGEDRPVDLIIALTERDIERQFARRR